ncbi:hypothetical protein P886_3824 [Alteromonadaceae bacterium 2753L.S.0a.02]|nr:hypothetical protein P886_3824 [Alteromonadaceae bacterium 2753L.S.0a.02]
MTHSPLGYPGYHTSVSTTYNSQRSAEVVRDNEDGSRVSVSASLSTSYSYTETRYTPSAPQSSLTYQAPSQPAAGSDTQAAAETAAVKQPSERNAGAATILAFIEQRLVTDLGDGATLEELQSRLQAGFEGFMQGYGEALEQIKAMGLYEGDVKTAVDETYNQVLSGFAELADKFGLENPAPEPEEVVASTPEAVTADTENTLLLKPKDHFSAFVADNNANAEVAKLKTLLQPVQDFYTQQIDKEESESRLYRFNLRTADGDTVSIQSYADRGYRFQSNGDEQRLDIAGMEDFQFSVNGELDAGEMKAISDLLSQINDIAEVFFAGDVDQAFEKALEIGFDSDEIARFSLNLTQVEYSRIENTYGAVAQPASERLDLAPRSERFESHPVDNKVAKLAEFVRQLENFREHSGPFDLKGQRLQDFAQFATQPRFGQHPSFHKFAPFVAQLGNALDKA